jgi:hypothetical protein
MNEEEKELALFVAANGIGPTQSQWAVLNDEQKAMLVKANENLWQRRKIQEILLARYSTADLLAFLAGMGFSEAQEVLEDVQLLDLIGGGHG